MTANNADRLLERTVTEGGQESYWFWCPGCEIHHRFVTKAGTGEGEAGQPVWGFNADRVTFRPSLLCNGTAKPADLYPNTTAHRCHLFVTQGEIQFLADCTHALAGKTVPLEPVRW